MSEMETTGDPTHSPAVTKLVDYYRRAAVRMQGLPNCNAALTVEAVGFREFDGREVGVIVTPWFMNLTALPATADTATWRRGASARLVFPSGSYDFIVGDADENGLLATCSLFPLMHEFTDQASARDVARAATEALFEAGQVPPPRPPAKPKPDGPEPDMSKRRLFFGR